MTITTALTTVFDADDTAEKLAEQVLSDLDGQPADLCLLFASAHFEDRIETLADELHERLHARVFAGVTAESVINGDQEFEGQPALALWAAHLPGAELTSFHLSNEDLERLGTPEQAWEHLRVPGDAKPTFIVLGDPFTFNPTPTLLDMLDKLEAAYPGRPVIGGMASAAEEPGQNLLIFEGQTLRHGLVGIALWGDICVDTVVSQGCRPIGQHMVVTRADGNIIYELGGKPPLEAVRQLVLNVEPRDRRLLQKRGLLVGSVINEYQKDFSQGDFLIRNPIGFDPNSGAMAINDLIRTGQTVQFHVRDEDSAARDLDEMLSPTEEAETARGALLFTCNGRGTRLFKDRNHDARALHAACGGVPTAGFFAAGEIGPVGQRSFIHGHTVSIGLFRPSAANTDD